MKTSERERAFAAPFSKVSPCSTLALSSLLLSFFLFRFAYTLLDDDADHDDGLFLLARLGDCEAAAAAAAEGQAAAPPPLDRREIDARRRCE